MITSLRTSLLTLLLFTAISATAQATAVSAKEFVQSTSQSILDRISNERSQIDHEPSHIYTLIDELLLPHIDFEKMSRSVLGKYWRRASTEQRAQFVDEFRMLLVRTYSTALLEYSDETIDYLPVRAAADATDVTVRTEIRRRDGPSIPISYDLYHDDGHWMVYDVSIDHISLVTNYRSTFASQIRRSGFDNLIKQLHARNSKLKKQTVSNDF
jgi:phospholipid transport system substrate-binding protein